MTYDLPSLLSAPGSYWGKRKQNQITTEQSNKDVKPSQQQISHQYSIQHCVKIILTFLYFIGILLQIEEINLK